MLGRRVALALALLVLIIGAPLPASASVNVADTVSRSDIFVGQPNILPTQAMPLGNGRLGVAIWAADGMTLQLNRADTLPGRLSPGQVVFDSLKPMIADRKFQGRLDLFNGEWRQSGAGLSVQVIVDSHLDRVIVDVAGADPHVEQTVSLKLWKPRSPTAHIGAKEVSLAEHWLDNELPGASGLPFGSLAGLRVVGADVTGRKVDDQTVAMTFHAMADGHYRVIIASPSFNGRHDPAALLAKTLDPPVDLGATHRWWNDFWTRACLINATSHDGRADYFETLRTLYLFYSAAQNRGVLPGSQAGIADLFASARDTHLWDPAAFWEWNLRMQVAANLSAGLPELNEPYFALYRNNLDAIHRWTLAKMGGRGGICVPETMRFNGVGVEYESVGLRPFPIITHSCDLGWSAVANARTLSTGAEVGLWVWETYLKTGDAQFLRANYPLMAEAARFLLAYQHLGADGLLHTSPSNAHETQSDVLDPTTDLSAIRSLYPATIAAARTLSRDSELSAALAAALAKTPPLPLIDAATEIAPAAAKPDATPGVGPAGPAAPAAPAGQIIAPSYNPTAPLLNAENIGLEPVWPYSLISSDSPLFETAVRTYEQRPFRDLATWSNDPIHAARLGLGSEMSRSLFSITQLYQIYPNGMAHLTGNDGEFYIEQMGVVSVALA
ncbi:MAG: alpha-L-fucosidase 2, partial [Gammaproteobacteria bacterium]|nr:alpha-L-fucosidase 2 [Gammaproteobacteria bacterium]